MARLTDPSRLAGTLAFLSKSISYLCFQASAGREGHAQCQLSVTLPVPHSQVLHPWRVLLDFQLPVRGNWVPVCLNLLCPIFNSLLDTSLRQKQEQQMTSWRGDCQENNEIQQSYTCGDCSVCDSRCYVQLQPIKGKLQDMIPRNGFISSIPLYTKITK